MNTKNRSYLFLLLLSYCVVSLGLLLYSYTQVDLNLTLSRINLWQTIQKSFQYVGFFQRPLSTMLYLIIIGIFFVLYGLSLLLIRRGILTVRNLWWIIGLVAAILVWSYPAFSADMFNYMFTAKTVLVYHKNPYAVLPNQFSGVEPWLTFMRWVHLPSAYTPLWIALTIPPYLFGFGYFLLILWNMKILIAGFYVASVWCTGNILERLEKKNQTLGMAILALNPLVIIESLVSAHNDIAMMALALLAFYIYMHKKHFFSWILLSLSAATKLITVFLIPVMLVGWRRGWALTAMVTGLAIVLLRPNREFLPWYFVWVMPFVALLPSKSVITVIAAGLSLGLLLRYPPNLYFGHWNTPVSTIIWWSTVTAPLVFLVGYLLRVLLRRAAGR